MASIDKRPGGKWRARWREYAGGPQKTRHFDRKVDAVQFLDVVCGDLARGIYVDPKAGRVTFRGYAEEWRKMQPHRASTQQSVEQDLRLHVYPRLGSRPLASIRSSHVQSMVTALADRLAPSTLTRVYGRVVSVFAAAVRDRLIASSPCVDVRLPRGERAKAVSQFLTTEHVHAQAGAISPRYRALIVAGAGTGLRPGELFGLTAPRVDFLRRQVHVEEQLVRVRGAGVELGPLKTESSYRTVPLPSVVADALAAHMAAFDSHPDLGLIFTNERSGPIQQQPFAAAFETARKKAGLPEWATPHDLRHYFASLLIRSGSSVKVVQKRLGHASAMTTLDTYVHLWPDEEDRTRDAVDAELAVGAQSIVQPSTNADLMPIKAISQV